jgi:glycosyltransferase involved in cell wall biosynthesis
MHIIIPTYNRMNYVKDSLLSVYANLMMASKADSHKITIVDNASSDGTLQLVEKMVADWKDNRVTLIKMNQNCGKALAVNLAIAKVCTGEDEEYKDTILCSFDSDLVINNVDTRMSFFDRLENIFILAHHTFNIGVLCVDQTDNSVHDYREFDHLVRLPKTEERVYVLQNGRGLAGGCMATYLRDFAKLGGYRTDLGIFGGNDGYYIGDVCHKLKKRAGLAMSISVKHPKEHDPLYHAHKKKCVEEIIQNGKTMEKGFYDK